MTDARVRLCLFAVLTFLVHSTRAEESALPPRIEWRASSSSVESPALASKLAIDGDVKTRWGGPFSAGHWFQVDLGRAADVGGVLIRWDSGYAASYTIQHSLDGKQWQVAFDTDDSPGDLEYVFFPVVKARYLRLASKPRTADWMASMFEFEPLARRDVPQLAGLEQSGDVGSIWSAGAPRAIKTSQNPQEYEVTLRLPRALPLAGLEVFWGSPRAHARLEARAANGRWQVLDEDPDSLGDTSFLAAREAHTPREMRLIIRSDRGTPPAITRLRLLSPSRVMTPLKRYEITASRAHRELFPDTLHRQQVYWTAIGVPAGVQKSVLDEYGNLEAFKGAPLVQPLWRDESGRATAATTVARKQSLREGWMPMPAVEWSPQPGLSLSTEAFTLEHNGAPVTLARYRLQNTSEKTLTGRLNLLVRPLQVNPQWQHGGVAPIREIAFDDFGEQTAVRVNSRILLHSLSAPTARGAASFGVHGETELTHHVAEGTVPAATAARDTDGLAAAMLVYYMELPPGSHQDVVLAFPLGNERVDISSASALAAPPIDSVSLLANRTPGAAFDELAGTVAQQWQSRVGRIELSLPDRSLVDMLRAQVAYMLINQTGPAMQPGPRNYNRSFIRDGSATAAILARMGMAQVARDFLKWYSDHAVHPNGLVSPILNEDGSVNRGFGSDIEHDSQGQFVWLVAEIARVDGGPDSVREYQPKVRLALKYLEELRNRTLATNYASDREAPERFRGLIAPSISHEGYSVPTHSYWDDYYALKGWHDGAWLADGWGDKQLAQNARQQYALLRESVRRSIQRTIAWKGIDFIPASADLADWDATSVSIALDPAGQMDLLPQDTLRHTFDLYLKQIRSRNEPDALYAYTPYEMRNVLTYVRLNKPQEANEVLTNLFRHRRPAPWHVLAEVVHSRERYDGYLGDMPHTWIGAEYVRAILGMLMREDDERLVLLPGAPPEWLQGAGVSIGRLPTVYGPLSLVARGDAATFTLELTPGLRADTKLFVSWPSRRRPTQVLVDGAIHSDFTADGIAIDKPFSEVTARWE